MEANNELLQEAKRSAVLMAILLSAVYAGGIGIIIGFLVGKYVG